MNTGLGLWLRWVLANSTGGLLGFVLGAAAFAVGSAAIRATWPGDPRPLRAVVLTLAWAAVWSLIAGPVVAGGEWLVLPRALGRIDVQSWLRLKTLLWPTGTAVAGLVAYLTFGGATSGAVSGVALVRLAGDAARPTEPA